MKSIVASRWLPASREVVFEFLLDLENHWHLTDRFVEVLSLDRERPGVPARGGAVRVHGPMGTRRTVATRVIEIDNPAHITGEARAGSTLAHVRWGMDGDRPTRVTLAITIERTSTADRLLLTLGGRLWLRRRLQGVLDTLGGLTRAS